MELLSYYTHHLVTPMFSHEENTGCSHSKRVQYISEIPAVPQQQRLSTSQHFTFSPSLLTPKTTLCKVFSRHIMVTTTPYEEKKPKTGQERWNFPTLQVFSWQQIFLKKILHGPKRSFLYLQIHIVREQPPLIRFVSFQAEGRKHGLPF